MSSFTDNNDFNSILSRLLDNVDDTLDKREGSIIYDALAPAAAELAQCYIALDVYANQTNLLDATGENLDNRVADYGVQRIQATKAQVIINTYDGSQALMAVPIGSRFSVPNEFGGYNYEIIEEQSIGTYIAECETTGTVGNSYIGQLLPLQSINNLGDASITSIYKPAEDTETDDTLRARVLRKLNQDPFAGNQAAYREALVNIDGVEDCKIYPAYPSGGYVKIAIIAPNHTLPSSSFIDEVQEMIDPVSSTGEGVGIAPIGHKVTIGSPTGLDIDITATLELDGATISQITDAVKEQLANYIYQVQNDFIEKSSLLIYLSKISAAILNVKEVKNVTSVLINGEDEDLEIDNSSGASITYPIFNASGVVLNESN